MGRHRVMDLDGESVRAAYAARRTTAGAVTTSILKRSPTFGTVRSPATSPDGFRLYRARVVRQRSVAEPCLTSPPRPDTVGAAGQAGSDAPDVLIDGRSTMAVHTSARRSRDRRRLALAGCTAGSGTQPPATGGSGTSAAPTAITIGLALEPTSLDFTTNDGAAIPRCSSTMSTRAWSSSTPMARSSPDLATKWTLGDGNTTYTFDLVPNATFHQWREAHRRRREVLSRPGQDGLDHR